MPKLSKKDKVVTGSLYLAKLRKETALAVIRELEAAEKGGKLIDRAKVEAAAFNTYRSFRDQILTLPDRLAAIIAAEPDEAAVRQTLDKEIRDLLTRFADRATRVS